MNIPSDPLWIDTVPRETCRDDPAWPHRSLDLDRMMGILAPPRHHYVLRYGLICAADVALEYGLTRFAVAPIAMNSTMPVEWMAPGQKAALTGATTCWNTV